MAVPNAPTLNFPISLENMDTSILNDLTWTFSDPDPADTQSRSLGEIRRIDTGLIAHSWDVSSALESYSLAAGTLTIGKYEWRVKTYDAAAGEGAWSDWAEFRVIDTSVVVPFRPLPNPTGPGITHF